MIRGARLLALTLALGGAGLVGSGCTLERRGEPGELFLEEAPGDSVGGPGTPEGNGAGGGDTPGDSLLHLWRGDAGGSGSMDPGDRDASVRMTLEVFRESVRVGDLSLALDLLHPEAVLLDDLVARDDAGSPPTRGEHLLALRRRHAGGLGLRVLDSELRWVGDAALLRTRLLLTEPGPDADSEAAVAGWARESALLVPTPEGWRILHLHRSLGPGTPPDPAPPPSAAR